MSDLAQKINMSIESKLLVSPMNQNLFLSYKLAKYKRYQVYIYNPNNKLVQMLHFNIFIYLSTYLCTYIYICRYILVSAYLFILIIQIIQSILSEIHNLVKMSISFQIWPWLMILLMWKFGPSTLIYLADTNL